MKPRQPLHERDVTRQIRDFLEWRHWRPLRMQVAGFTTPQGRYQPIGEQGQPDWLFIRYDDPAPHALVLWVEMKRPGARQSCPKWCRMRSPASKKLCSSCAQRQWRAEEERRGALVVQPDNFEEFARWYGERFPDLPVRRGAQEEIRFVGGGK